MNAAHLTPRETNLADARLGAAVVGVSDDFFAAAERMLAPHEPEWREGVYDEHGKWMDGWESRRRRDAGHDWCILRLARPGIITGLDIDTRWFTGNYPPGASVEGCHHAGDPGPEADWQVLLPVAALAGDSHNRFPIRDARVWTHLRVNMLPDGGIARLRAYGRVHRDWQALGAGEEVDLAAAINGGLALACSDEHYGAMDNLLLPGRGADMSEGWETRRRREPGYDWVLLRLAHPGRVHRVEIDTAHFKGNYPHQVSINAALMAAGDDAGLVARCLFWPELLAPQRLAMDRVHAFEAELADCGPVSHVRVNIHPDGGLSRVRLLGRPHLD